MGSLSGKICVVPLLAFHEYSIYHFFAIPISLLFLHTAKPKNLKVIAFMLRGDYAISTEDDQSEEICWKLSTENR